MSFTLRLLGHISLNKIFDMTTISKKDLRKISLKKNYRYKIHVIINNIFRKVVYLFYNQPKRVFFLITQKDTFLT